MFCTVPDVFNVNFQPENYLTSMEQVECYKARAKALARHFKWSDALRPVWTATLVHSSTNVPGKIAYYSSVKNMLDGRLTRTSPEMFLERILQYAPDDIKAAWKVEVLGNILPTVQFISNTDPEGWQRVYNHGPHSCMHGAEEVSQYAHPKSNLNLAYIQDDNPDFIRITHRAIVNTKRKTYLRIYGKDCGFFVAALARLGYKQSDETLKDEYMTPGYSECQYCENEVLTGPYLDGRYQGVLLKNRNDAIVGQGSDEFQAPGECQCDNCRNGDDDDEY
jgi:hypothetical protein